MPHSEEKEVHNAMVNALGKGPMRFGAARPALDVKSLLLLHSADLEAFIRLQVAIENHDLKDRFGRDLILRVAMYHQFDEDKCVRLLKHVATHSHHRGSEHNRTAHRHSGL